MRISTTVDPGKMAAFVTVSISHHRHYNQQQQHIQCSRCTVAAADVDTNLEGSVGEQAPQ